MGSSEEICPGSTTLASVTNSPADPMVGIITTRQHPAMNKPNLTNGSISGCLAYDDSKAEFHIIRHHSTDWLLTFQGETDLWIRRARGIGRPSPGSQNVRILLRSHVSKMSPHILILLKLATSEHQFLAQQGIFWKNILFVEDSMYVSNRQVSDRS